ncbi:MoaD/ThiS family protein [Paraflavitalea pollutisoli]|uniref:MoaD/ThiS family protein n=1 Tax=Paraflavitalea pollutisoli TaxID=3034143 RepID=UPI0023ECBD59|nr:MoaD/ThiS family protein [Paraflavitalea sp. H1-2-19X]
MAYSIRLFGQIAEMAGATTLEVDAVADVQSLRATVEARIPGLQQLPYLVAVDKDIVTGNAVLESSALIALLPPYSGG